MKISYISYGKHITGGHLHELFFAKALCKALEKKSAKIEFSTIRFSQFFIGLFAYFKLQSISFKALHSVHTAVVVSRMSWVVLFKQVLNQQFKSLVVLHHLDWSVPSSKFYKIYLQSFLYVLNRFKIQRIGIIVVSPFWLKELKQNYPHVHVFLFPNLFNSIDYESYRTQIKSNYIHLGQWSWKNDPAITELAKQLNMQGYICYFSSNIPEEQCHQEFYEIICEDHSAYLKRMAAAQWTLALSNYQEGWNRTAHESILVGTPVIGYANGGLSDLLQLSHSKIVKSPNEAFRLICQNVHDDSSKATFIEQFHTNKCSQYLQPILQFLG